MSKTPAQRVYLCGFCQCHKLVLILIGKGKTEIINDVNIFQVIYVCSEHDTLEQMGCFYSEVCPHFSLELQTLDIRKMEIDYLR